MCPYGLAAGGVLMVAAYCAFVGFWPLSIPLGALAVFCAALCSGDDLVRRDRAARERRDRWRGMGRG